MLKYEDLLTVPWKSKGRNINKGLDCYGLVLELCRRNGTPLIDITEQPPYTDNSLQSIQTEVNLKKIQTPSKGCIMQCFWEGVLHVGFMLDAKTVIHMTDKGARTAPVFVFNNPQFYEVMPWQK